MERTLVLLKPDCLQRGLAGEIMGRFEHKGLKVVGMKMMKPGTALWREHYAHLLDKPFYPMIEKFMSSGPVIAVALEGLNAVDVVRKMSGVTKSYEAQPGTIRGDFALSIQCNTVHASDTPKTAEKELKRFFSDSELFTWEMLDAQAVYGEEERK